MVWFSLGTFTAILVVLLRSVRFIECSFNTTCLQCLYSTNAGCDIVADYSLVGQSSIACQYACTTSMYRSSSSAQYNIRRDCSTAPECTNSSYSTGLAFTVTSCCTSNYCNDNLGPEIFECFECYDEDGSSSNCSLGGFTDDPYAIRQTVFCSKYCQKRVRKVNGVTLVQRSCQDACTTKSYTSFGVSTSIYCCTGDLCNTSAKTAGDCLLTAMALLLSIICIT